MKLRTGATIFIILALCCLAGPLFISGGDIAPERRLEAPSASHPMGTDTLGRDVLLRCLLGGRTSLSIGLLTEVGDWDTGFEIRFTRLTMEWLTDGADDGR